MRLGLVLAVASPIIFWTGIGARAEPRAKQVQPAVRPCPTGTTRRGAPPPKGLSVWCEQAGIHHGPYTMWYAGGQLMRRGFTDHGVLQGKQLSWYANGQMADRVFYVGGAPAGRWTHWYRNGQVASVREFRGGKPHGIERRWHRDGTRAYVARYRWGKLVSEKDYDHPVGAPPDPASTPEELREPDPPFPPQYCYAVARAQASPLSLDEQQARYRTCMRAAGWEEEAVGCHLAVGDRLALNRCINRAFWSERPRDMQRARCLSLITSAQRLLDRDRYLQLVGHSTVPGFCGSLPRLDGVEIRRLTHAADAGAWLRAFADIAPRRAGDSSAASTAWPRRRRARSAGRRR